MNIIKKSAVRIKNGLPFFLIQELVNIGWVQHGFLTRKGGVSPPPYHSLNLSYSTFSRDGDRVENVYNNKNLIATTFGFNINRLILLRQIHKDEILILREPLDPIPSLLEYDAMITNLPNIFLGIRTADCLPIFVINIKERVIGALHAGRRGTALHITRKVLRKMKVEFSCSPKDFLIIMGPSIGPCCYEIDEKVFQPEWEPFSTFLGDGKWMVDLSGINVDQMKKEGIKEEQIFKIDLCTHCHNDLFFSHRKEGRTGTQISFIGIKE